jgi:hypothetical protein
MKKISTCLLIFILLFTMVSYANAGEVDGFNVNGEPIDNSHLGKLLIAIKYVPDQDYALGKIEIMTGSNSGYGFDYPACPLKTQVREDDEGKPSVSALTEVTTYINPGFGEDRDENDNYRVWQGEYLLKPIDLVAGNTYWIVMWNVYGWYFSTPIAKEPNDKIEFYKSSDGINWQKNSEKYAWMVKLFDDEDRPFGQTAPGKAIVDGPIECDTGEEYSDFVYEYTIDIPLANTKTHYNIDWGDGTSTGWKKYSPDCTEEKIWKSPGIYQISVQAKKIRKFNLLGMNNWHIYEYIGETSDPYEVEVSEFYNRDISLIQHLFFIFPIFERFFRLIYSL